jgi:hypothetical protein
MELLRIALLLNLIPSFPLLFIFEVNQIDLILIVSFLPTRQLAISNFLHRPPGRFTALFYKDNSGVNN